MEQELKSAESNKMSEVSERRLWKTLDDISHRLLGIETQLSDVVRLEERMHNHEEAIMRYGKRLDNHDRRIRDNELWQANHGDRSSSERLISNIQSELHELQDQVGTLKTSKTRTDGQKDVTKEVLKWLVAILTAVLIYKITRG